MATIIVRPVGNNCNLKCKYCYVNKIKNKKMSIKTFSIGVNKILKHYLNKLGKKRQIEILFHGGEPLLAGIDFYKSVEKVIKKFEKKYSIFILRKIQTNLTLYTEDYAFFFGQNNYRVSLSLDGPQQINDKNRLFDNGKSIFKEVISKLKILNNYQKSIGAVVVIGKDNYFFVKKLYSFFKKNNLNFQINFLLGNNKSLTVNQKIDFTKKLMKLYFKDDPKDFKIPFIDDYIKKIVFNNKNTKCKFSKGCVISGTILCLDFDGKGYLCNRFAGLRNKKKFILFNIFEKRSIAKQLEDNVFLNKMLDYQEDLNRCKQCALYNKFCFGKGCVYENILLGLENENCEFRLKTYNLCKALLKDYV